MTRTPRRKGATRPCLRLIIAVSAVSVGGTTHTLMHPHTKPRGGSSIPSDGADAKKERPLWQASVAWGCSWCLRVRGPTKGGGGGAQWGATSSSRPTPLWRASLGTPSGATCWLHCVARRAAACMPRPQAWGPRDGHIITSTSPYMPGPVGGAPHHLPSSIRGVIGQPQHSSNKRSIREKTVTSSRHHHVHIETGEAAGSHA